MTQQSRHPVLLLIAGFICVILISALLAPVVKWILLFFSPYCALCASLSEYELHRIFSRVVMVTLGLFLYLFRRKLFAGRSLFSPLAWKQGAGRWFAFGFAVGLVTLALQVMCAIMFDARQFYTTDFTWMKFVTKAIKAFFSASLIGLIEEFLLRGLLFAKIKKARSFWLALVISSAIYSIAHFFRPKDIAAIDELTLWSGFVILGQILTPFASPEFIYESIGLFFVGACLAFAYHYSKSLYFAIGLHAGWVFVIKMDGMIVTRTAPEYITLWGSSNIVGGVYTWILLALIILFIRFTIPGLQAKINGSNNRTISG